MSRDVPHKRATATAPFAIKEESSSDSIDKVVRQNCEVISIPGSEPDFTSPKQNLKEESVVEEGEYEVFNSSSPGQTIKEGIADIRAVSPASSIAPLMPGEIPCSSQKRVKRKLHAATQGEDFSSQYEPARRTAFKRF